MCVYYILFTIFLGGSVPRKYDLKNEKLNKQKQKGHKLSIFSD